MTTPIIAFGLFSFAFPDNLFPLHCFASCGAAPLRVNSLMPLVMLAIAQPAAAADPAAQFITKLFINVCVPNLGQPAGVRQWAQAHRLPQIDSPAALGVFVGNGSKGAA